MRNSKQKLKLLYLIQIFDEYTDEEHGITMSEIIKKLDDNGIKAERKSIYDDIEQLGTVGYEIVTEKLNRETVYKTVTRKFDVSELKMLVDVVQASKFISKKDSEELIKKLEGFTSKYEAKKLQRQVYVANRVKAISKSGYYNIDAIHDAIYENKQISFDYYMWNTKKELVIRNDGNKTDISPWALSWDDENYYMVAFDSAKQSIRHYRVDKMKDIKILNKERDGKKEFEKFDAAKYTKQTFGMFTGNIKNVQMEFDNSLVGVVVDRFGTDVMIIPKKDDKFTINVDVSVSSMFYSWVAGFEDKVKILGPQEVVDGMKNMIEKLSNQYKY